MDQELAKIAHTNIMEEMRAAIKHREETIAIPAPVTSVEDLAQLIPGYRATLVEQAKRFVRGDPTEAEDIVQQAFLNAVKHLKKGEAYNMPKKRMQHVQATEEKEPGNAGNVIEKPEGWLKTIVYNTGCNFYISNQMRLSGRVYIKDEIKDEWLFEAPEPALLRKERDAGLHAMIEQLPPLFATVIKLHYFEKYSYQRIADELGRPLNTVRSDIHRARSMLKEVLTNRREIEHSKIARRKRRFTKAGKEEQLKTA
jgi:RNA polymerase sigma factor (sigma-70 family)